MKIQFGFRRIMNLRRAVLGASGDGSDARGLCVNTPEKTRTGNVSGRV
jgi:hypothetical protein